MLEGLFLLQRLLLCSVRTILHLFKVVGTDYLPVLLPRHDGRHVLLRVHLSFSEIEAEELERSTGPPLNAGWGHGGKQANSVQRGGSGLSVPDQEHLGAVPLLHHPLHPLVHTSDHHIRHKGGASGEP